jgi:hypothetical protein
MSTYKRKFTDQPTTPSIALRLIIRRRNAGIELRSHESKASVFPSLEALQIMIAKMIAQTVNASRCRRPFLNPAESEVPPLPCTSRK